jgi:Protein of unknown function (DUF3160)
MKPSSLVCLSSLGLAALVFGCDGGDAQGPSGTPAPTSTVPGIPPGEKPPGSVDVSVTPPTSMTEDVATLKQALSEVEGLDSTSFAARYPAPHVASLGYDPGAAAGLDKIKASRVAPTQAELDLLAKNGFVISASQTYPTFTYGFETIYAEHLPLYVSADAILDAVHRSYDGILESMEQEVLIPELRTLLAALRGNLAASDAISQASRVDVDFYLAVALSLLDDRLAPPVAGAASADVSSFVSMAKTGSGSQGLKLFGVDRAIDASQFTPRGHYSDTPELSAYFRAMMWLGRIDFRLIATESDGTQTFNRRQFDAMLAIASLFDQDSVTRHRAIDGVIQAFVGESDNMQVKDVATLLATLGAPPGALTVAASDKDVAQAILDGGYGAQRIASQIMINGTDTTLPLDRSFLVFGQRYVLDSHVFSNVVYDRAGGGKIKRMMPNPLDAAFAALGNNDAGTLLAPELSTYHYEPDLASMRVLADAHGADFWGENLYNLWLSSLRGLSPDGAGDPAAAGMPLITGTEPWGRRILNTQLSSWAELRHDTILYAKQSYTGGNLCEFPDAYVDPYPEVYSALKRFADYAAANVVPVATRAPGLQTMLADYFQHLGAVMQILFDMATDERAGTPFSADQMAFINDAVTIENTCGGATANGWYPRLVYGDAMTFDPTIADVHTQPTDEAGNDVGRVLHVGTGYARLMVVTTNTCTGPRAYAGLAATYYEKVTEHYDRLTDERWQTEFSGGATPADVPWMSDLVAQ